MPFADPQELDRRMRPNRQKSRSNFTIPFFGRVNAAANGGFPALAGQRIDALRCGAGTVGGRLRRCCWRKRRPERYLGYPCHRSISRREC